MHGMKKSSLKCTSYLYKFGYRYLHVQSIYNKRPHGLTSSAATLTLGPEIRHLGHIIEIHIKVSLIGIYNKNDVKPVGIIWDNDWRPELWSFFHAQNDLEVGPLRPIFNIPLNVADM